MTPPLTISPALNADRRRFLGATASAFAALTASGCMTRGAAPATARAASGDFSGYGTPVPDPAGLLDLPEGFAYRVMDPVTYIPAEIK